ncbi:exonuclease domain-containing protein [Litchfieldella xinjiangensis]|uniref:3'-5' exonuclease n=1 Tax=Litchfieldella xinjiangensis TaxID=1166948 RepID=UPI0018CEBDF0|nr:exonuclease domain-containing protein [Halomonas xinjiangensis]
MDSISLVGLPLVTFLDVEASGLDQPASYPIEVGWADTLGNSDSFLIRPSHAWTHWDDQAKALHGISRGQLLEEGLSVIEAAQRLNDMLGVETVYCDAVDFDGFWLGKLFKVAGIEPTFRLADMNEFYAVLDTDKAAYLKHILRRRSVPHRALGDAARYANACCEVFG